MNKKPKPPNSKMPLPAAASTVKPKNEAPRPFRRRSKSLCDLKSPANRENVAAKKPTIVKPVTTIPAKRPLERGANRPATTKIEEKDAPKVAKVVKPAPYDYKARYMLEKEEHDKLKEKFKVMKTESESMSEKLSNYDAISTRFEELKKCYDQKCVKGEELARINATLKIKCDRLEFEHKDLTDRYDGVCQSLQMIQRENDTLSRQNAKVEGDLRAAKDDICKRIEAIQKLETKWGEMDDQRRRLHEEIQCLKGQLSVNSEGELLKSKIKQLEEELHEMKELAHKQSEDFELECQEKDSAVRKLELDLKTVSAVTEADTDHLKSLAAENNKLRLENDDFRVKVEELEQREKVSVELKVTLENTVAHLNRELQNLKENVSSKRNELAEGQDLIQTNQDELALLRIENEALRSKPLDEKCKGNSLFAEVNDRRLEMQTNYQCMKEQLLASKCEQTQLTNRITKLQAENVKLCQLWETQESERAKNQDFVFESYESRIKTLEELLRNAQTELKQMQKLSSQFFTATDLSSVQKVIDRKSDENNDLQGRLIMEACTVTLLSKQLKNASQDIANLKVQVTKLENAENLSPPVVKKPVDGGKSVKFSDDTTKTETKPSPHTEVSYVTKRKTNL